MAQEALYKIRESVKYVKTSDERLREFHKWVEEVHLDDIGSFLRLDVSTRWNAHYMMLERAIKYHHAFNSLTFNDRNICFAHPMKSGKEQRRCVLSWPHSIILLT